MTTEIGGLEIVGAPGSFIYAPDIVPVPEIQQAAFYAQSKKGRYGSQQAAKANTPFLVADFAAGRKSLIIENLATNTQRLFVGFDDALTVGTPGSASAGLAVEVGGTFSVDSVYTGQVWVVMQNTVDEIRFAELVS